MSSIATTFAEALSAVSRPSAFFVAGTQPFLAPGLIVEGVGSLALPLLPVQAEQLIAIAARAPFGRGEATLTDTAVRRTWQIAPDQIRVAGKHWAATLQAIVARVVERLGVADPVEAELYKLLIYDKGSFFVPHRDTEKVPGMFATLVLALPSVSEGGELIIRHKDQEAQLSLHCDEPSELTFAAFYADCVHEVRPVTAGYRLVLVYNLIRRGPGRLPGAPDYTPQEDAVAAALRNWAEALGDPDEAEPDKLIYPLEHAYTPAELSFGTLKGADAGIAQVVVAAARRTGCEALLALILIEESGSAEYSGSYRRPSRGRYRNDDEDEDDQEDFEVLEIIQQDAFASDWRRPDGEPCSLTALPVTENEFSPPLEFEDLEPDEQHFHEATGNEGASFERTYRRAALILWPRDRVLAVINQGGLSVTLPYLADLTERWVASGDASVRDHAAELSDHMMSAWEMFQWYPQRDQAEPTDVSRFLELLLRLEDISRSEAFLEAITDCHGFDTGDCAAIAAALQSLPSDRSATLATRLIESAAENAIRPCTRLLSHLSTQTPAHVIAAARILVAALPADPAPSPAPPTWHRAPSVRPDLIVDLFTALGRIDATLAAVSADHVLECPRIYDFDANLIPAVRTLLQSPETASYPAVEQLRAASVTHLDARIALPLDAPGDWQRDNTLGCDCKDCQLLGVYLGDATQKVWVFAAAEPRRRHVESTIRYAACDVDTATERRGSPHRLICTKNRASYERRCVQRTNDQGHRAQLTT